MTVALFKLTFHGLCVEGGKVNEGDDTGEDEDAYHKSVERFSEVPLPAPAPSRTQTLSPRAPREEGSTPRPGRGPASRPRGPGIDVGWEEVILVPAARDPAPSRGQARHGRGTATGGVSRLDRTGRDEVIDRGKRGSTSFTHFDLGFRRGCSARGEAEN